MNISKNVIEYVDDRMGHDFRYSVNCMKAEKDLSFAPGRNFNDSLKSTIAWYQNNQRWWENSYTND
jgi:dTDP-glucose 4,6-dehydratase